MPLNKKDAAINILLAASGKVIRIRGHSSGPLAVGVTGGIGSGKTSVCKLFEALGIPVYYSDDEAKRLMVENRGLIEQIKAIFGAEAYLAEGALNRKWIGEIVFKDKDKLTALNAVVHPAVLKDSLTWEKAQTGAPYIIKESALIFETGLDRYLDQIISVFAPLALRRQRIQQRDHITIEEIERRMNAQLSEQEKIRRSDFVIYNVEASETSAQVTTIHLSLLKSAENR